MNNTEKKLDALIDALRFDVEETKGSRPKPKYHYKLTKRKDERPSIKAYSIGSFGVGNQ